MPREVLKRSIPEGIAKNYTWVSPSRKQEDGDGNGAKKGRKNGAVMKKKDVFENLLPDYKKSSR